MQTRFAGHRVSQKYDATNDQCLHSVYTFKGIQLRFSIVFYSTFLFSRTPPTDFTVYRVMLRQIRRDERRRSAMGSYAFIAQENDIRVLIDQVWLNRSILSNVNVHTELRLIYNKILKEKQ